MRYKSINIYLAVLFTYLSSCDHRPSKKEILQIQIDSLGDLVIKKNAEVGKQLKAIDQLDGQREALYTTTNMIGRQVDSILTNDSDAVKYLRIYDKETPQIVKDFFATLRDSDRWDKIVDRVKIGIYGQIPGNDKVIADVKNSLQFLESQRAKITARIKDDDRKANDLRDEMSVNNDEIKSLNSIIDDKKKERDDE